MILVTGSSGLIGRHLCKRLRQTGHPVRGFDAADDPGQDIRNSAAVRDALVGVCGIVHLAAVSRVVWAQRDPDLTESVNVTGLRGLLMTAMSMRTVPWFVSASSREVYGEPYALPVAETAPLRPLNVYARSKVAGEELVAEAAAAGMIANVARFSNVFGCTADHPDRVVPAFARAAAFGGKLDVEGADNTFDFTHVEDVARGLHTLVDATACKERFRPIHFVSGQGTTLRRLAAIACRFGGPGVRQEQRPARNYDVGRFVGDPRRAREMLGWTAEIDIQTGFDRLASDFAGSGASTRVA